MRIQVFGGLYSGPPPSALNPYSFAVVQRLGLPRTHKRDPKPACSQLGVSLCITLGVPYWDCEIVVAY